MSCPLTRRHCIRIKFELRLDIETRARFSNHLPQCLQQISNEIIFTFDCIDSFDAIANAVVDLKKDGIYSILNHNQFEREGA